MIQNLVHIQDLVSQPKLRYIDIIPTHDTHIDILQANHYGSSGWKNH